MNAYQQPWGGGRGEGEGGRGGEGDEGGGKELRGQEREGSTVE